MAQATGAQLVFEVALWATPTALAVGAALRAPRGRRAAWWVVAAAGGMITADKAVDLQTVVMGVVHATARAIAPELRSGGSQQLLRVLFLGGAAALGMGILWYLARLGRPLDGPRYLSLVGLCVVLGLLAARLVPDGKVILDNHVLAWTIELLAWLLVTLGAVRGLRRPGRDPSQSLSG